MASLRTRVIRAAHDQPSLRPYLLPILKESSEGFDSILQQTVRDSAPGMAVRERILAHVVKECQRIISDGSTKSLDPFDITDAILETKPAVPASVWLGSLKWAVEKCLRKFDVTFVDISANGSRVNCMLLAHTKNVDSGAVGSSVVGKFVKNVSVTTQSHSRGTQVTVAFSFTPTTDVSFWIDDFPVYTLVRKTIREAREV